MILDDESILIQSAIDSAHYEMVDLGLSVKWANKNVGASDPEDAGLYFQWGDTIGYTADQVGKDKVFDKYSYAERLNVKYNTTDGLTVLESVDDAATVHMGAQYRIPTSAEIQELISGTTQTFIDLDGNEYSLAELCWENKLIKIGKLKGVRFTSSNGNSIFIPAVGLCIDTKLYSIGVSGNYWSSNLHTCVDNVECPKLLHFLYNGGSINICDKRYHGQSIRGVEKIFNKS